ncbi:hypothetical protein VHUM_03107 [Vanrija humicola]|uniref:Uncharacterized protein n=1 Tax=Vanrija humicola TaxID=5417 RepID=A0A7D8Z4B5_VANHU|nr:hypothetical protein VHUM_03107 [Vanrija humicola]
MSLRAAVLSAALPNVARTSFTRAALSTALSTLPPTNPEYRAAPLSEDTVDTLFGPGASGPRVLVRAWEDAGLEQMAGAAKGGSSGVRDVLASRLAYSASVGEHLVEQHALDPHSVRDARAPAAPGARVHAAAVPPVRGRRRARRRGARQPRARGHGRPPAPALCRPARAARVRVARGRRGGVRCPAAQGGQGPGRGARGRRRRVVHFARGSRARVPHC